MSENRNSVLYRYTLSPYGRNDQNEKVAHYCWLCKTHHTIPRKDWVLLVRTNRINHHQRLNLVCKNSLWQSKYGGMQ